MRQRGQAGPVVERYHLEHLCSAIAQVALIKSPQISSVEEDCQWRAISTHLVFAVVEVYRSFDSDSCIHCCHKCCWDLHSSHDEAIFDW